MLFSNGYVDGEEFMSSKLEDNEDIFQKMSEKYVLTLSTKQIKKELKERFLD